MSASRRGRRPADRRTRARRAISARRSNTDAAICWAKASVRGSACSHLLPGADDPAVARGRWRTTPRSHGSQVVAVRRRAGKSVEELDHLASPPPRRAPGRSRPCSRSTGRSCRGLPRPPRRCRRPGRRGSRGPGQHRRAGVEQPLAGLLAARPQRPAAAQVGRVGPRAASVAARRAPLRRARSRRRSVRRAGGGRAAPGPRRDGRARRSPEAAPVEAAADQTVDTSAVARRSMSSSGSLGPKAREERVAEPAR